VAIHAPREDDWLLEVAVGVATGAAYAGVFAFKRKLGFGMIEVLVHCIQGYFVPTARVVAGLASLRKAAAMRIFVTVGTLIEGNANVPRLAVSSIDMALGAWHVRVQSVQRIASLGVVELADTDRLPVHEVMTSLAILSETSLVLVLVAGNTIRGDTQVRSARIFDLDCRALLQRSVRRIVALDASQASMSSLKQISCVFVIKTLDIPVDQRKVFPVVLGMTAGAFLARS
jgi:hypothetical protein